MIAILLAYDWIIPGEGSPRRKQFEALFSGVAEPPRVSIEEELAFHDPVRSRLQRPPDPRQSARGRGAGAAEASERPSLDDELPPMAKGITTRMNWLPTPIQQRFLKLLRSSTAAA